MKKLNVLTRMLLLVALLVGSVNVWGDDYELYSGTITEGDYVIYYSGKTLKNTTNNNRFTYGTATPDENIITNPSSDVVWHIAANGNYWTIYNASVDKYAGGTGTKNQGALLSEVTDYAKWTISGNSTYEFENLGRTNETNKWLRNNGTNGWACYGTGTGGAVSLYKKVEESGEATTVTIDDSEITNTNKFVSTSAGSFSASVTYGSPASAVPGAAVTWSSETESVATINETTGVVTLVGAGTTKIVASYAGVENEYKSSFAEYVLTVTDEDPNAITLWSENFGGYSASDVPKGGIYGYSCVNGDSNTRVFNESSAGGTAPELLVGKNGGSFSATIPLENIVGNLQLKYKTNAKLLTISTSTENISISGSSSFNTSGEHIVTFTGVTPEMTSITIIFTPGTSDNVRLDDIILKGSKVVPVKIGSNGWASLISDKNLNFKDIEGLTAYRAELSNTTVTLYDVTEVDANKGIVLRGTENETYYVPVLASTDADVDTDLTGNATAAYNKDGEKYYYVLANKGGVEGFYEYTGTAAIPAGKAFFETSSKIAAGKFSIVFADDETDGIKAVSTKVENGVRYNLAGQKVGADYKGIVIVNGKKYLNK